MDEIRRCSPPSRGQAVIAASASPAGGARASAALEAWARAASATACRRALRPADRSRRRSSASPPRPARSRGRIAITARQQPASTTPPSPAPLLTQWLGLPLHAGWWGTAIVGDGGRLFIAWASRSGGDRGKAQPQPRSISNGTLLWERSYKPREGSKVKLQRGALLPDRAARPPARGRGGRRDGPRRRTPAPRRGALPARSPAGKVKWMALSDGTLAMLGGDPDQMKETNIMTYPANPRGTHLAAYDLASGRQLWSHDTGKPVDERMVAVHNGRLYAYAAGGQAFCLDLKSGAERWSQSSSNLLAVSEKVNTKRPRRCDPVAARAHRCGRCAGPGAPHGTTDWPPFRRQRGPS